MVILWLIIAAIGIHDLVSHESIPLHGCFHVYFNTFFQMWGLIWPSVSLVSLKSHSFEGSEGMEAL